MRLTDILMKIEDTSQASEEIATTTEEISGKISGLVESNETIKETMEGLEQLVEKNNQSISMFKI